MKTTKWLQPEWIQMKSIEIREKTDRRRTLEALRRGGGLLGGQQRKSIGGQRKVPEGWQRKSPGSGERERGSQEKENRGNHQKRDNGSYKKDKVFHKKRTKEENRRSHHKAQRSSHQKEDKDISRGGSEEGNIMKTHGWKLEDTRRIREATRRRTMEANKEENSLSYNENKPTRKRTIKYCQHHIKYHYFVN